MSPPALRLDISSPRGNNIGLAVGGAASGPLCTWFYAKVNLSITLEQPEKKLALFGSADRYLRMIRDTFGVQLVSRDDELRISGEKEQVSKAAAVLDQMQRKLRRQDWLSVDDVGAAIGRAADENRERSADEIDVYTKGTAIRPKTDGQKTYMEAILGHDLTFCSGPAGTGKTYLAVAAA